MERFLAINETGLMPSLFRDVCDSLGIDSDQDYFTSVEISQIREKAGKKSKIIDKTLNGYSTSECSELLGITAANFSVNYSKRVTKIRRGFFSRESVDKLVASRKSKSLTNGKPTKSTSKEKFENIFDKPISSGQQRIQRLSVGEDESGNAIVSIYLENISSKEALQALVSTFT